MANSYWQKIRLGLIILTFFGVFAVLIRALLLPYQEKKTTLENFVYPENVPIINWQQIESRPLTDNPNEPDKKRHLYQYSQGKNEITIQTQYQQYSDSNMSRLMMIYAKIPAATPSEIKYREDFGYYSLLENQGKIFLTACLNPRGDSTVNAEQQTQNRYLKTMGIMRTVLWVIGQKDLTDSSCLWTLISIPYPEDPNPITLDNENLEKTHQRLEQAWFSWYQWWKKKLPNS